MKRLTDTSEYCNYGCDINPDMCPMLKQCHERQMYNKLREYEELEEKGLLLRLPCKVGDTVWIIYDKEVYEAKATNVIGYQGKSLIRIYTIFDMYDVFYQDGRTMKHQTFGDFGKTVFLTIEEAEAALAKMKGE